MRCRWLPGLLALLVLALAGNPPPALALPVASTDPHAAAAPCHGEAQVEIPARPDRDDLESPACCPDGCPGHCMITAALIPAVPTIGLPSPQTSRPAWPPSALADRPPGAADRPPRA